MNLKRAVASALVAILLAPVGGLAQGPSEAATANGEIVKVPHQEALHRLFAAMIHADAEPRVRFEILGGEIIEGSIAALSTDQVIIVHGYRRVVPLANIVGLRPQKLRQGRSKATAFGIGAAAGGGIAFGFALLALVAAAR
jgi:hypothetical protein